MIEYKILINHLPRRVITRSGLTYTTKSERTNMLIVELLVQAGIFPVKFISKGRLALLPVTVDLSIPNSSPSKEIPY